MADGDVGRRDRNRWRAKARRVVQLAAAFALVASSAVALGAPAGSSSASDFRCRGAIATLVGTAGNDRLIGTSHDDVIVARAGNDLIRSGGGDDRVCDNGGKDHVVLGAGEDEAGGGDGNDRIEGGAGNDWLAGRDGKDTILGGRGADRIIGELGDDNLNGQAGDDRIGGGPGMDRCDGGPGRDRVRTCERGRREERPDRPPVAANDADSTSDAAAKVVPVLSNDSDPDGDALHVASVDRSGTIGSVALTGGGGSVRYDPAGRFDSLAPGESATDQFTYTLQNGTAPATVVITIAGTDTDPVAVADGRTVTEDDTPQIVDVLGNDTDADGGTPSTIASVTQPPNGTVAITGGGTALTYEPSEDYCKAGALANTDNFGYTLAPGGASAPVAVTVTCVNDAPELSASAGTASFVEDAGPVPVDDGFDVLDVDSANLSSATVAITGNLNSAEDSLDVPTEPWMTAHSYDDSTGVLTIEGDASVTDYVLALHSVTYSNSSDTPSELTRTMTFQATDSSSEPSPTVTRDVSVTKANDPPVAGTGAGSTTYTENGAETVVDNAVTVTDPDDANIESATVSITGGFNSGDALTFTNQLGITHGYNSGTGVLTLTGPATKADFQTAIRTVKFASTNDNPAVSKTVAIRFNDGDANSNAPTKTIAVTRLNDAPTLATTGTALAYGENAGPVAVDTGLTATDPDSTQIGGATVQISSNFVAAEDQLNFATQSGITGVYDDATGTMTLSGNATVAQYQAALRAVTYDNSSNAPTTPRTVSFQATDVEGDASNSATRTINISAANDSAVVTTSAGATAYTEGPTSVVVDNALTVADDDDANLEGATVSISANFQAGDSLEFANQAGITGNYVAGTGILTLSGTATKGAYETALRTVGFVTTHDDPAATKTVEFKANDGDGLGNGASKTIAVTGVNDKPTITTTATALSYEEGDAPTPVDDDEFALTDPDSAQIQGATVQITANHVQAEDELAFTDTDDITGDYDDATGKLTLSGADSVADYQAALRSVTYENTSGTAPTESVRTVTFQARDDEAADSLDSDTATRDVSVGPVNDAPTVTTSAGDTAYTEGDPATVVDSGVTVADVDDANIDGGMVRISSGFQTGDTLTFTNQAGITGNYDSATGVLTLSNAASKADYQTALRSITFDSSNSNPVDTKTVEFKVTDGDLDSTGATKDIAVTPDNSPPEVTATAGALGYTENGAAIAADNGLTVTDPDSANLTGGSVSITAGYQGSEDTLDWVDNNLGDNITEDVSAPTPQTVVLTGIDSPGNYQAALRAVTYVNSSDAPTTAARTITFSAQDDEPLIDTATRTLNVTATDDPPVAAADSATVLEDAAATSIPVLTNDTDVDGGPKTISSATDPANGTVVLTGGSPGAHAGLTYQPDPNYCNDPPGTTPDTFNYTINGGTTAEVAMTVTCVNDAPVADDETFNGAQRAIGNTSLVVNDPTDSPAMDPAGPEKTTTGDILAGDTDIDGPGPLTVTSGTFATDDGGSVVIEDDGDFTYHPAAGASCSDHEDSFDYTVEDSGTPEETGTGTVTIAVVDCVWYVDDSAAGGGDGRSHSPLNSLTTLNGPGGAGDPDGTGDHIFLYDGSYTGGLTLEGTQKLFTEDHGLSVPDGGAGNVALEAGDGAGSDLQGGLTLASGNSVQGLDLGTTGSSTVFALSGTSVGTANVNNLTGGDLNNPAGGAVNINGGALNVQFGQFSSAGSSSNAVRLDNTTGTFSASSGTLSDAGTTTVHLNGGTVAFTLGGNVSDDAGQLVFIQNKTGGTNDFNGLVSDAPANGNGGGVSLQSNSGSTTRFDGGLNISTTGANGVTATGGGTLAITDPGGAPNNTITTSTGTPLNLAFTTIGDDDLTFERIASSGAASGIALNTTTNANGSLIVTGTGAGTSGGTIQGSSGAGITLDSVPGGVDLSNMAIQNGGNDGIRGNNVSGFALRNSSVTSNGNAGGESGMDFTGLTGTVLFNADTVSGSADHNLAVVNDSGALNMTVTNGTYSNTSSALGNDGIMLEGTGTGSMTAAINGSTFSNNKGDHVQVTTDNSNTVTQNVTIQGTTMTTPLGSGSVLGGGISVTPGGDATTDVTINGNDIQNSIGSAIRVDTPSGSAPLPVTADVDATITNNTIGTAGTARSGSYNGDGMSLLANGNSTMDLLVTGNNVTQYTNKFGIALFQGDGTSATMNATVRGNLLSNPNNALAAEPGGIHVRAGLTSTPAMGGGPDAGLMCLDVGGAGAFANSIAGAGLDLTPTSESVDMYVWQRFSADIDLPLLGAPTTDLAAKNYLINRNSANGAPTVYTESTPADTGFHNRNTGCPTP